MNRFQLTLLTAASLIAASVSLNSCKAPSVAYTIIPTVSLRVMNFAPNCTAPMDVFWWPTGQTRQAQPQGLDVGFGQASVYSNLLPSGVDNVLVTPHLILNTTDLSTTVNLAPPSTTSTGKYTIIITSPSAGVFKDTLIQDGVQNPASNLTYVRFINLLQGVGPLTVHVNDAVTGDLINATPDDYGQVSTYTALGTANDSSYAFLVTNERNQIIARLAYQTFTAGNCYTLIYAGDLCNTLYENPADSTQSAADTLRLRAFDDNSLGNDQTYPPTMTFRYNIINDIFPNSDVYNVNNPQDTTMGFLVNGIAYPQYFGFSIPPVDVYQAGGENQPTGPVNGAYDVNYQSAVTPTTLVIQGYATDASGSFQQLAFDAGAIIAYPLTETSLTNSDTDNNRTWSLLMYDTFPSPTMYPNRLDTELASHFKVITVPDMSWPNGAIIEFIAGIVLCPPNKSLTTNSSLFYLQVPGIDTLVPAPGNAQKGMTPGNFKTMEIPLSGATQIMVTDSIGEGGSNANVRVFGNSSTFTAQPGGIYEIVSEGTKVNPHMLIIHVNNP